MPENTDKRSLHPETFFLPPLKMVLTFLDREPLQSQKEAEPENQEKASEQDVEKLIEKLSEKEE